MPAAIFAALRPTRPPPRITTFAGATPGTPPSNTPRPPYNFSRYFAPSCTAMRPATSDIGVTSGSPRDGRSARAAPRLAACAVFCPRARFPLPPPRKMEIREDELTLAHVRPFLLDRLLHLHDHLAVLPDGRRIGRDLRADAR